MKERTPGPVQVGAAAVAIGGLLILVMPDHAMSLLRLVIATLAGAACVHAFNINAPPAWWNSPFDRIGRSRRQHREPGELDWIRAGLSGRRQRTAGGPPLPPGVLRLLQPLIHQALEGDGFDPADPSGMESARDRLSPLTFAVLCTEPMTRPPRFRTFAPDGRRTAEVVLDVLEDLERAGGSFARHAEGAPPTRRRT